MNRASRLKLVLLMSGGLSLSATGCTTSLFTSEAMKSLTRTPAILEHGTEQRAITQFTEALSEDKETAFRRTVSTRFEQQAMRSKDSFRDLEILSLPKVPLEVVESTEADENRIEAVAKEKDGTTKYQFIIVRDAEKKRWVVDDVLLRQKKKGTRATKSAVEVMDLLLTIREFVDTWQTGQRDSVMQAVSSDLRAPLESLPQPWLEQLIHRVNKEYENGMARRPEAQMNESDAVVKLPSKNGFILLKVVQEEDQWLVSDIEIRNRKSDHHPGSILRQARALNAVSSFLNAYNTADQDKLKLTTEEKFYESSLSIGDLSMIPLPAADFAPEDFEIQSFAGQLTITIPENSDVVRLDLLAPDHATKDSKSGDDNAITESENGFVVANVTIYNRQTRQQRNLRSAFTAPARAMLFLASIQSGDLPILRQISSTEFSENTWRQMTPELLARMPLDGIPSGEMTLQNSEVRGELTELEFMSSAGQVCSVTLREQNGNLMVDDVEFPGNNMEVASLRTCLTLATPVVQFAQAWHQQDLDGVRKVSSTDFNRLVWSNVAALPDDLSHLPSLLEQPILKATENASDAVILLGRSEKPSVSVRLLREHSAWVVDEISLLQDKGVAMDVRKTLRHQIAEQFLSNPAGEIQQAGYSAEEISHDRGVVQAVGQTTGPAKRKGNLTMPPGSGTRSANADAIDVTDESALSPLKSVPEESGILRFGPEEKPQTNRKPVVNRETPHASGQNPKSQKPGPLVLDEASVEHDPEDGTMYFNGGKKSSAVPAKTSHGIDPTTNPVEIP